MADPKVVRVINAADNETIEIHWWKRSLAGSEDPQKRLTEILIERHTAPPADVWATRLKAQNEETEST
jgi:hypothetical protein